MRAVFIQILITANLIPAFFVKRSRPALGSQRKVSAPLLPAEPFRFAKQFPAQSFAPLRPRNADSADVVFLTAFRGLILKKHPRCCEHSIAIHRQKMPGAAVNFVKFIFKALLINKNSFAQRITLFHTRVIRGQP